ncbi:MAG: hypothetical protein EOO60_00750 [Hymenobacter sp.]|nr:MAG: hypothetical protein EOO60_00750 [Hymenobacter sp.]
MHLSLPRFQLLRPRAQLLYALTNGTFLARRWQYITVTSLYFLPNGGRGFFAEVGLDEAQDCFVVLRSFSDSEALADYAHYVQLPE